MGDNFFGPAPYMKAAITSLLVLLTLLSAFPMDVMLPSYPELAIHLSIKLGDVPSLLTAFAIGFALSQILIGPLSDHYGRKKMLLGGLAVSLIGILGCIVSDSQHLFLLFRLLQGAGCGCFVLSQALIQDFFSSAERQRIRIFMTTFSGICISLSPLFGSGIQLLWGWKGSFYVSLILTGIILAVVFVILDPATGINRISSNNPNVIARRYLRIFRNRPFVCSYLVAALGFTSHFAFIAVSPLIFMAELQLSTIEYSYVLLAYGIAYVIAGMVASRLSKKLNLNMQIHLGLALSVLSGVSMVWLLAYPINIQSILIPMALCTFGTTLIRPASATRAMDAFSDGAGIASAAGGTLIFVIAGLISALLPMLPWPPSQSVAIFVICAATLGWLLNQIAERSVDLPISIIEPV